MTIDFLEELEKDLDRFLIDEQLVFELAIIKAAEEEGTDNLLSTSLYKQLRTARDEANGEFEELSKLYADKASNAETLAKQLRYDALATLHNSYPETLGCFIGWLLRDICGPMKDIQAALGDMAGILKAVDVALVAFDVTFRDGLSGILKLGGPLIDAVIGTISSLQTRLLLEAKGDIKGIIKDVLNQEKCSPDLVDRCLPLENFGHFLMDSLDDLTRNFHMRLRDMWSKSDQKYRFKLEQAGKLATKSEWIDTAVLVRNLRRRMEEASDLSDEFLISKIVDESLMAINADMIYDRDTNRYIPVIYRIGSCGCDIKPSENRRAEEVVPEFIEPRSITLTATERLNKFSEC